MSGIQGQMLGHIVRRGVEVAQQHFAAPNPEYIQHLQNEAEVYENAGKDMGVNPSAMLPFLIIGIVCMLLIASVRYTLGEVAASLTMIESPSSTAILEPKPPAYTEEPDAPLEKEPLMAEDADVEVTVINHKPITAKVVTTIGHLHRVGGFRARWRGLGLSVLYHAVHNILTGFLCRLVGLPPFLQTPVFVFVSVALCRVHMLWTHSMIAYPSSKPWFRRFVPRKQCKALLLPSLVFALAQQATILLPLAIALVLRADTLVADKLANGLKEGNWAQAGSAFGQLLSIPASALLIALALLLPAAVTLTRVEACLLPEGEEAIVPFDRAAIMEGIDISQRGGCRALFIQAWRSFDRASRGRLIKLYVKMVLIQITIVIVGLHTMLAAVYLIGIERLSLFYRSGSAQLKLMAIEAEQNN